MLLGLSFPGIAAEPLPELGAQTPVGGSLRPHQQGETLERRDVDSVVVVSPGYSRQTGFSLNAAWARQLGASSALEVLFGGGADQFEGVLNLVFDLDARQSLVFSAGQLRQSLEFGFASGAEHACLTQHCGGISYLYQLGQSVGQSVGPSVHQPIFLSCSP